MSFASFATADLRTYLQSVQAPDALWFFAHVPKTAGTSMSFELNGLRPPYANITVDYDREDIPHDLALRQAVGRFCAGPVGETRAASGHVPAELLGEVARARAHTRFFTILRDPVRRVISDYTYQTTPEHPPFEAFRKRYPTIEDYVLTPTEQNKMFFFAAGEHHVRDFDAAYRAIEQRFSFIGLVELYDMSFNIITRLMGTPALPTEHRRVTNAEARARVPLTPALIALIRQVNDLDQRFYDRVAGAMVARLADWQRLQAG